MMDMVGESGSCVKDLRLLDREFNRVKDLRKDRYQDLSLEMIAEGRDRGGQRTEFYQQVSH